ncbi:unannotated protein [freshwater metagenome]|uniref:Unannotated protein n=1 Tax=freshwater metagenome TaxID=449393 RepID=A0A6J6B6R2_9ZZZZ
MEGCTIVCQQRLVGRHHTGATINGGQDEFTSRLNATNEFDNDVGLDLLHQRHRISTEQVAIKKLRGRSQVMDGDSRQFDLHTRTLFKVGSIFVEQSGNLRAHYPTTKENYA